LRAKKSKSFNGLGFSTVSSDRQKNDRVSRTENSALLPHTCWGNGGGANSAITLDSAIICTLITNGGLDRFLLGSGDKVKDKTATELGN